jgi:uncharacterized membrane-anchored protein YjiN (DUF445 family)
VTLLAIAVTALFTLALFALVTAIVQKDKDLLINALLTIVSGVVLLSIPFVYRGVLFLVSGEQ